MLNSSWHFSSKIHFVGIGGIGVSGIAHLFLQKGFFVSGSDQQKSEITEELKKRGAQIFIGHRASNVPPDASLVVYSEAVPLDNVELRRARKLKIKVQSGAQALADFAKDYFLIAVSGMHGKSTTASMISRILIKAGFDPTFVIGTRPGWRLGKSPYMVIEADDYQAKFLHYYPDILVLTNIEKEHMDFFKDFQHIKKVFSKYVQQVKGFIVANKDDENTLKILMSHFPFSVFKQKVKCYSLKDKEALRIKKILKVPGEHNVSNALAALKVARLLGISDQIALKALSEYKGVWRRFQETSLKIKNQKVKIISDYAHHPTEIKATFQALQEKYAQKRVWVVFQPHQYQRTFYLFQDFVKTFQQARNKFGIEKIIITDIYSVKGREKKTIKQKVNSQKLALATQNNSVQYIKKGLLKNYLQKHISDFDVLVVMGAGDIYYLVEQIANAL